MEKDEKVQFILEQMRLGLARKDYIRTQIISKKISVKFFASTTDSEAVQVRYTPIRYRSDPRVPYSYAVSIDNKI